MIYQHFSKFEIRPEYFDHHSLLHGINHTFRVMVHVLEIGNAAGLKHEIPEAFCAAFIHDMGRNHDGWCTAHGHWSATRKLPLFKGLFQEIGIDQNGMNNIKTAATFHSQHDEPEPSDPAFKTIALLKDADALDRIRISEDDLRPELLRFPESHGLIGFAKNLFYETHHLSLLKFSEFHQIAMQIK